MTAEFKKGDLVRHVLGQRMQVKTVHSVKLVECFWFDAHGTPHTEGFLTIDLTPEPADADLGHTGGFTPGTHEEQGTAAIDSGYGPRVADDDHDQV